MNRLVGFHAHDLKEMERLAKLPGVNLMELKTYDFDLFKLEDGVFRINDDTVQRVSDIAHENSIEQVQLHLPYETSIDPTVESGLCPAIKDHHQLILDRFRMIQKLYEIGIASVVTMHPPTYSRNGEQIATMKDATERGRQLLYELDRMMEAEGMGFKVGIENMPDPKHSYAALGFEPYQLKQLLGETQHLGLTIDAGHRILSANQHVKEMFGMADIVNLHFHANSGQADEHELATPQNLRYFDNYVRQIRRRSIPVVLEISSLGHRDDFQLADYVAELRQRLS